MEIKVNGMMCPHCEAHVKKALEALDFVVEAKPSHKENKVVLVTSGNVDMAAVKAAVAGAGYEFVG